MGALDQLESAILQCKNVGFATIWKPVGLPQLTGVVGMKTPREKNLAEIAERHLRTVKVCIDELQEADADAELRQLGVRLQELASRARSSLGRGK